MRARELWMRIESLHAVTYFASESLDAAKRAGTRGFWMGYFGFRAAPLGPVGADVVEATFANFAPAQVRRAVPDVWSFADPATLIDARSAAAAAALRRTVPGIEIVAASLADRLRHVIDAAEPIGRPLFATNRSIDYPDDPVRRLWQCCTTLREHRGDGHVATLTAAGVDGCAAHWLLISDQTLQPETFFDNRGWTTDEQQRSRDDLVERGLVDDSGLTSAGRALHNRIERTTDELAIEPFERAFAPAEIDRLIDDLDPLARAVQASGTIPFPNPMGLPPLDRLH